MESIRSVDLENEKRICQESVDSLFDNTEKHLLLK
jgi:DNA-directed RNA polymerase beta' subunit